MVLFHRSNKQGASTKPNPGFCFSGWRACELNYPTSIQVAHHHCRCQGVCQEVPCISVSVEYKQKTNCRHAILLSTYSIRTVWNGYRWEASKVSGLLQAPLGSYRLLHQVCRGYSPQAHPSTGCPLILLPADNLPVWLLITNNRTQFERGDTNRTLLEAGGSMMP